MNWLKLSKAIAENAYARSIKSVSPDGLGKESAIKTQLGLIKQTTGKDVKVEAVIDFTLLRQVLAGNQVIKNLRAPPDHSPPGRRKGVYKSYPRAIAPGNKLKLANA